MPGRPPNRDSSKMNGRSGLMKQLPRNQVLALNSAKMGLRFRIVVQKLRDARHEYLPEISNPNIRYPLLECDKVTKEVDNGGYNVHPVPPLNSEIKERIRKRYESKIIMIEQLLTVGYQACHLPS